jgi:hypothetical protein
MMRTEDQYQPSVLTLKPSQDKGSFLTSSEPLARDHVEISASETAGAVGVKEERLAIPGQRRCSIIERAIDHRAQIHRS